MRDDRRALVRIGATLIADTRRAVRALETASPPTFYLPPDDIDLTRQRAVAGSSACKWKGRARYWSVVAPDGTIPEALGRSCPEAPAFASIAGGLSFYPGRLQCEVEGERVQPQPGGFYGGARSPARSKAGRVRATGDTASAHHGQLTPYRAAWAADP